MTGYYFNENPQMEHWMGKRAILQQEYDKLSEEYSNLSEEYVELKCDYDRLERDRDCWLDIARRVIKASVEFNFLPWYKKMFYKFKL